jgi:ribosomal protein S18 acetylase RimI-like enzyme
MYNKYEDETTHLETIYTDNRFRKKGIMKKLLRESLKEMYDRYSLKEIHAENLIEDIRSDKSLFSAGFKVISIDSEMYEGKGGKRLLHKALS